MSEEGTPIWMWEGSEEESWKDLTWHWEAGSPCSGVTLVPKGWNSVGTHDSATQLEQRLVSYKQPTGSLLNSIRASFV